MVIERELSLGQLIAAELVVNAMVYGLTRLGKTLDNYYELLASIDKISYLLDLPQEIDKGAAPKPGTQPLKVEIKQLCMLEGFQFDNIKNLDLELQPGTRLALSHGADRGTLLELLYGLRLPFAGRIRLDEQDLRDLSLGALRDQIALVHQAEVMDAAIVDNVAAGRSLELSEIRAALDKVGLLDEVSTLPDGLNTNLCAHGVPLSPEQCLRLTLARAIAARPRLLLIDRLLDSIDEQWLPRVLQVLFDDAPWTLIVVSHDARVIERCDRHAHIRNGGLQWVDKQTGEPA